MVSATKKMLKQFWPAAVKWGYDSIVDRGRRKPPERTTRSEDAILDQKNRRKLSATARDNARNFALTSWIVRRHLDYVSSFTFQAMTPDEDFNTVLEAFVARWSTRHRFDIARRHPKRRYRRIAEARRVLDGDFGYLKIAGRPGGNSRGKVQGIEGDKIFLAKDAPIPDRDRDKWVNGVLLSDSGQALKYALAKRSRRRSARLSHDRFVDARNLLLHAYYDSSHRIDQCRGIGPINQALNTLRDLYEGMDMALLKLKLANLFGVFFTRSAVESMESADPTADDDDDGKPEKRYETSFGSGPLVLDLDPGDDVTVVESKTPAIEQQQFLRLMIMIALKAIDLPFSFFDESFSTFYGSRGGLIQYKKSCKSKIEDNQETYDELTNWRVGMAIEDGELILPAGVDFPDVKFFWVPDGVPWWDAEKEVRGAALAVAAGFDNFDRVCRSSGTNFKENVRLNKKALDFARGEGVQIVLPTANAFDPAPILQPEGSGDPANSTE